MVTTPWACYSGHWLSESPLKRPGHFAEPAFSVQLSPRCLVWDVEEHCSHLPLHFTGHMAPKDMTTKSYSELSSELQKPLRTDSKSHFFSSMESFFRTIHEAPGVVNHLSNFQDLRKKGWTAFFLGENRGFGMALHVPKASKKNCMQSRLVSAIHDCIICREGRELSGFLWTQSAKKEHMPTYARFLSNCQVASSNCTGKSSTECFLNSTQSP